MATDNSLRLGAFLIAIAATCSCFAFLTTFDVAGQENKKTDQYGEEVDIVWRGNDAGIEGVRASFLVESTREIIWSVLLDYDRFPEVFQNVRQAKVLKESADGAEVEFVVNAKIRDLHYVLDRRYLEYGRRITWKKLSGDLKSIEGGWTIEDGPKRGLLRMTYESYVEVGWYVPAMLVRISASREVRKMVRALRARLADHQRD